MPSATRRASTVAQMVKSLPPMREILVRSPGQEDPLEKEMATPQVFLPGKSHGLRSLVDYSTRGHKEMDTVEQLHFHFQLPDAALTMTWVVSTT